MTKAAAWHKFMSSFGLPAYEENSVPDGDDAPDFPYLTYSFASGSFDDSPIIGNANLWYRSTSWVQANAKAEEISLEIGRGGVIVPCDGGSIWIQRGEPFSQSMGDETDKLIKRKYLVFNVQYFTSD